MCVFYSKKYRKIGVFDTQQQLSNTEKKGRKMEDKKWYTETYFTKLRNYEALSKFLEPLNNEERQVIGYQVHYGDAFSNDKIIVTFARLK